MLSNWETKTPHFQNIGCFHGFSIHPSNVCLLFIQSTFKKKPGKLWLHISSELVVWSSPLVTDHQIHDPITLGRQRSNCSAVCREAQPTMPLWQLVEPTGNFISGVLKLVAPQNKPQGAGCEYPNIIQYLSQCPAGFWMPQIIWSGQKRQCATFCNACSLMRNRGAPVLGCMGNAKLDHSQDGMILGVFV